MPPARILALSLAIAFVPTLSGAQEDGGADAPYYDGTWTLRMQCKDGGACPARLVLSEYEGTLQYLSGKGAAKQVCGRKKLPVTVQASTKSVLAITAFGDVVSPSCPTLTIVVKPVDAKTLAGTVENGVAAESPELHAGHAGASAADAGAGMAAPVNPNARPVRLERR